MSTPQLTEDINAKFDPTSIDRDLKNLSDRGLGRILDKPVDTVDLEASSPIHMEGFDPKDYNKSLGSTYNPLDPTLDQQRADSQGRLAQFAGFLNQAVIGEAIGGTINGLGILMDIFDGANYTDTTEKKWTNWLSEAGENIRKWTQDATPIYQQHEGEFAPWSWSWWMTQGPSVVSTLSLMLPAAIPIKGLSLAAKALHIGEGIEKGLAATIRASGKLGKVDDAIAIEKATVEAANTAARLTKKLTAGLEATGQAVISRHLEDAMEATQSYDDTYNTYMASHQNEPDAEITAKKAAAKAAATTYQLDAAMLLSDIIQYTALPKFSTRAGGNNAKVIAAAEKNALLTKSASNAMKMKLAKTAVLEVIPEGIEEGWQFIAQEEGKYIGQRDVGAIEESEFKDRMKGYIQQGDFWNSAFMGAIGGVAFQAAADPLQEKMFGKDPLTEKRVNNLNNQSAQWAWLQDKYKKASESGDPEDLNFVHDQFTRMFGGNAIKLGNTGFALNFLEGKLKMYQDMTSEAAEKENIDKQKIIDLTSKQIADIKILESKSQSLVNKYGEIAPYIAEAEMLIDKSDEHLKRLEGEKETILKDVGARRSMSSFAEELLSLHHDNIGLAAAANTIDRMIDNNKNKPDGERLPESTFLRHQQIAFELKKKLEENANRIKEINASEEYTTEDRRKDKVKGRSAAAKRMSVNGDRIGKNRIALEIHKLYKEQGEETLNQLSNPTKARELITKKMLNNVMLGIKNEQQLEEFANTVDLKRYHNTSISNAVENKRKEFNDTAVNTLLAKSNLTEADLATAPKGILSKEVADKLKAKEDEFKAQRKAAVDKADAEAKAIKDKADAEAKAIKDKADEDIRLKAEADAKVKAEKDAKTNKSNPAQSVPAQDLPKNTDISSGNLPEGLSSGEEQAQLPPDSTDRAPLFDEDGMINSEYDSSTDPNSVPPEAENPFDGLYNDMSDMPEEFGPAPEEPSDESNNPDIPDDTNTAAANESDLFGPKPVNNPPRDSTPSTPATPNPVAPQPAKPAPVVIQPEVRVASEGSIKTTGTVNGRPEPIYDEDGVQKVGIDGKPMWDTSSGQHHSKRNNADTLDEFVNPPIHRFQHTVNGKAFPVRYDLLQDPNIIEDLNGTEGTMMEFVLLNNDYWAERKIFVQPDEYWQYIPIAVMYNGKMIDMLSANTTEDRKLIYDALVAGQKVHGIVTAKNYGFFQNTRVDLNKGKTDENGLPLPPKWKEHFVSFTKASKRWHRKGNKFVQKDSENPIAIITGLETEDVNQRMVESSHPKDIATGDFINESTIGHSATNDDKGHVYIITTDNRGNSKAFKLSTANLSTKAVDSIITLLKTKRGNDASEVVAVNENIPSNRLMSQDEAVNAQITREASKTFIQMDDEYTIYYSSATDADGKDVGFIRVKNDLIGSRDNTKFATRMEVVVKEKDGRRYYDIRPRFNDGFRDQISLEKFDVESDLRTFLKDKKYNVKLDFLRSNGRYISKVTGKPYNTYREYLDSNDEFVERKESSGRNSILAMDAYNDEGTLLSNTQLTFGKIMFDGIQAPKKTDAVIPVATINALPVSTPIVPSVDPKVTKIPASDISARTSEGELDLFGNLFSNNKENNDGDENKLSNFVANLRKDGRESTLIDKYNKLGGHAKTIEDIIKDIQDGIFYFTEDSIVFDFTENKIKNQVSQDKVIEILDQILNC